MESDPNQIQTEKCSKRRAACLCLKFDTNSQMQQVLLVRKSKHKWKVPGGGIELGELPKTAATREVDEEAGAVGKLDRLLDVLETTSNRTTKTFLYLLQVDHLKEKYEEMSFRQRKWFTIPEAVDVISKERPLEVAFFDALAREKERTCSSESSQKKNLDIKARS